MALETLDHRAGKMVLAPIGERLAIDKIVVMSGTQKLVAKKVNGRHRCRAAYRRLSADLNWVGYDEPNYTYTPLREKLLGQLAELSRGRGPELLDIDANLRLMDEFSGLKGLPMIIGESDPASLRGIIMTTISQATPPRWRCGSRAAPPSPVR